MARDMEEWRAFVNAIMEPPGSTKGGFLEQPGDCAV